MPTQEKLAVLGGDQRQIYMLRELRNDGWQAAAWGLGEASTDADWRPAVLGAQAVLLPLPASEDGVRIRCPLQSGASLRFSVLLEALPPGVRLLGGRLPPLWLETAGARGIAVLDYMESEVLQLRNALPTAEGAILLAMQELPVTLHGLPVAVVGYGRIGALLAGKLRALGADVTVCARRESDRIRAGLQGMRAARILPGGAGELPCTLPQGCRAVFNTVPCRILTEPVLARLPADCLLLELASAPGGFDPVCAARLGLRWLLAPALPGRLFPESAGAILAQTLSGLLRAGEAGPISDRKG